MERHLPVSQLLVWKNLRLRFGRMKCWPSWLVWAILKSWSAGVLRVFHAVPWLYLKICLDICLDWMLCICASIAFCFTSLVSKIQTPRLHPVRSEKKDQTLKEFPTLTLFRFSQLGVRNGEMEMDGDGWRDGMSSTAIGDPVHQFHWDRWKNSPVERRPSKIRVNQRSATVLEEKTQLETHSLQLA